MMTRCVVFSFRQVLILAGFAFTAVSASTFSIADDSSAQSPISKALPQPHQVPAGSPDIDMERHIVLQGRVTDPKSNPVANVKLLLNATHWVAPTELGTTAADGSYRFEVKERLFHRFIDNTNSPEINAWLIALSDEFGPTFEKLAPNTTNGWQQMKPSYEVAIQLGDDLPIQGQVRDRANQPVQGATVAVVSLSELSDPDWAPLVEALAANHPESLDQIKIHNSFHYQWAAESTWKSKTVVTDPNGQFRIAGIGRDRGVQLRVTGPGIAPHEVAVITRSDIADFTRIFRERTLADANPTDQLRLLYDTSPVIEVNSAQTVSGIVRDAASSKPVANVDIWIGNNRIRSGKQGEYRTTRSSSDRLVTIVAYGNSERYLPFAKEITNDPDAQEMIVDIPLDRGVTVAGKAVEAGSDRPIVSAKHWTCHAPWPGAIRTGFVHYVPLGSNDALRQTDLGKYFVGRNARLTTTIHPDGTFEMAVPPGPGILLLISSPGQPDFVTAGVWHKSQGFHRLFPYPHLKAPADLMGFTQPISLENFHAFQLINPSAESANLDVKFELQKLPTRFVDFVDDQGAPVAGVMTVGVLDHMRIFIDKSEAEVMSLQPGERRQIFAVSLDGQRIGHGFVTADETQRTTIRLQPCAQIKGRLIDRSTDKPLANRSIITKYELDTPPLADLTEHIKTDANGQFQIEIVIPDAPISINFLDQGVGFGNHRTHQPSSTQHLRVPSGQTRDLGDVRIDLTTPKNG